MLRRKEHLSVVIFTALAVAGTALLSGCGSPGQSPLASDQGTAFSSDAKASVFLTKRGGKVASTASASSTSTTLYYESDTKSVYSWDEEFNVRFSNNEVGGMQNVGHLKTLLASKLP